jgi:hypothetical protein
MPGRWMGANWLKPWSAPQVERRHLPGRACTAGQRVEVAVGQQARVHEPFPPGAAPVET